jgi:hypothetical protein
LAVCFCTPLFDLLFVRFASTSTIGLALPIEPPKAPNPDRDAAKAVSFRIEFGGSPMRSFRLHFAFLALSLLALALFAPTTTAPVAYAQTNTTGAISGVVTDPSGAVVPGAKVTVTNLASQEARVTSTGAGGDYHFSQLAPGRYSVTVTAASFEKSVKNVDLSAGIVVPADLALTIGQASQTIQVTGSEVPLLHTDDAQISTTFTEEQLQLLPNPGNDITFQAQTAPGSVMNTQSGYGNFSSFGLPGTSNTFTVNGGYYNDPYLNISNSGASNLALGANDVASVTVVSNAYNASFGGLGGAQVAEVSRAGTNKFHGNEAYWWNGRVMNANDFFNKQSTPVTPRSFDNVNQFAAAVGGPIKRDKTFFFVDYEGIYVVLPSRATIQAPDALYQSTVLANLTANGLGSETQTYQNIFNLYNKASGFSSGSETPVNPEQPCSPYCTWTFNGTAGNKTHEYQINSRIDQNLGTADHLFGHATVDKGVQATYTSLLNPLFDALSPQPSYDGQLSEQHTFSTAMSNQFLFSTNHYVAVFSNTNEAASEQIVPFSLIFADGNMAANGTGAWPGGLNIIWPQGRNVTGYQFQDDWSWTRSNHTLTVGWTMHRNDVTDFSPQEYTTSPEAYDTAAAWDSEAGAMVPGSFDEGYIDVWFQQFPTRPTQPVALYTMGWYVQDQWKPVSNLTLTYGIRMEHNSDPICRTSCFAHLSGDFSTVSTSTATAYNKLISSGLTQGMPSLQLLGYEPRVGFAYLPFGSGSKTTLRGGFGMFSDSFPGQVADLFMNNAPSNVGFNIYGPAFGGGNNPLAPAAAGSGASIAAASDKAFSSGFATGASFNSLSALPGFAPPSMATVPPKIKYATYEEWSFAVEHQLTQADSFSIMYVGNRSYHEPVQNPGVNAYNSGVPGFPELSSAPPNPNFSSVMYVSSTSEGNFNGLIASAQHRSGSLTVGVNYQWSHALDEISNGGFDGFSGNSVWPSDPFSVAKNYGNADYDIRQYVSGNYLYTPHFPGPKLLVDNWEVSGTVFHSTGLPFSVVDSGTAAGIGNYGWNGTSAPLFAQQTQALKETHCGGKGAAGVGIGTPCSFSADYTAATDFGQSARNQMFGPNYTDFDLGLSKGFAMPHWDAGKLSVGAQFFNLFNHYNFAQPGNNIASPATLGIETSGVNPPTSILGSFLGGDAAPRLIQLNAKFTF